MKKPKASKFLKKFMEDQAEGRRGGSGDDQAYVDEAYEYFEKQIKVWIDFEKQVRADESKKMGFGRIAKKLGKEPKQSLHEDHKFHKIYPNIPLNERENICCLVDDEPISWKLAKLYIDQKSDIGKKILENLKKTKVI